MTYDLDAAIREDRGDVFEFTLDGKKFTLPHQKDIDKSFLALADSQGGSFILDSLELALGDQWDDFNAAPLSIGGVEKLFEAWNEHSGVKPGE